VIEYGSATDWFPAEGYTHTLRIYAYKLATDGSKLFGPTFAEVTIQDDESVNTYRISWSWNAVAGADGYLVQKQDDYNGYAFDAMYDVGSATTFLEDADFYNELGWPDFYDTSITSLQTGGQLRYDDTGNLRVSGKIGANNEAPPGYPVDVDGDINYTGTLRRNGAPVSFSPWTVSGSNIYYTAGNVGIGTTNPGGKLYVAGNQSGAMLSHFKNSNSLGQTFIAVGHSTDVSPFNAFYFGNYGPSVAASGVHKPNSCTIECGSGATNGFQIGCDGNAPIEFYTLSKNSTSNIRLTLDGAGNVVIGAAALATTATNGFPFMPSCPGAPTGTPAAYTGRVPFIYDTTNNKLYVYNSVSSAWKSTTLA
jgi:hypothetical protein